VTDGGLSADGVRVWDGNSEVERSDELVSTKAVVVVAEVAGDAADGEPGWGEAAMRDVEKGVAGKHQGGGRLPGGLEEAVAAAGEQQNPVGVLDDRRDM
jgi:hypothetical protein